jgi:hypothetical protein
MCSTVLNLVSSISAKMTLGFPDFRKLLITRSGNFGLSDSVAFSVILCGRREQRFVNRPSLRLKDS